MKEQFLKDLVNRFPDGYACHKLILNDKGIAEDFVILNVNRAFEEMTKLKDSISRKKAMEVFPGIKNGDCDGSVFFDNAAKNSIRQEMSRYVDILGCRYKMTAYSLKKMHFFTILKKTSKPKSIKTNESPSQLLEAMFSEHTAVMLITEPISGKIVDANPAACAFYGYAREDLLNMCVEDISPLFKEEMKKRFPHRLHNGNIRMVDIYSSPILYNNNTYYFSIIFDVTEREKYKEDLYRQKELLRITFESIADGVVTTNKDGLITSLNKSAQKITGWPDTEAHGRKFTDVFELRNKETGITVENPIDKVLQTGKIIGLAKYTILINKNGCSVPMAASVAPIKDENGGIFGVVMIFRDVSKDQEEQEHIMDLSYHDFLTGLYNRRFVSEQLAHLDIAENLPLAIIIGDINGLKLTNDAFGHTEGDRLLKKVAESLKESCRREEIIIRWGGDEFLIILPGTSPGKAKDITQRIQNAFIRNSGGILQISVSLGYAVKEYAGENLWNVLKEAEKWMYHKKLLEGKSHRNNIINTLLMTLYENNLETEKHSKRLSIYCQAIAEKLDLSSEEQNDLSLLAMLHDIGKVGIRQDLIQKPGPLTAEEWEEVRRHSEIGYRIVQNTPELSSVSEYILLHHERWDGKGYPRGYKGEKIPLLCRILAVADAYDVMIRGRVYKKACSRDEAMAELKRNAGSQFDPEIVAAFAEIMGNKELPGISLV
ncbi:MAG TPA: HD domain-containing phosphohydrolase [Desulfitobacteriaceae bacterium]|jgi:diguanylate cyclase (GGDEF)-like protein/PAS domain S-box-containing protein|nr:HD domain-containing phosphohydrolase [Desulfitobacteriaceae bacterium]